MRAIGIILAGGNSNRMRELSNKRAIAAMPLAGSYRSIDFSLSNMSNSPAVSQESTTTASGDAVPSTRLTGSAASSNSTTPLTNVHRWNQYPFRTAWSRLTELLTAAQL